MDFWSTSDGEDVRDKVDSDIPESGGFEPLPDKTKVLAVVTEAGKGEKDGLEYAFATLEIVKPEGYAKRKLFPRFWVFDDNPHAADKVKKRSNDLRRFSRLDAACGGKLARKNGVPSGDDIALAFTGKQAIVQVMLMVPKNGDDPFNWYSDYFLKNSKELSEAKALDKKPQNNPTDDDLDDDSIPF